MVRKILFGPLLEPVPEAGHGEAISVTALSHTVIPPVGVHEIAGLGPLLFLIVVIGVYPRPVLDQMQPTLASIDKNTQAARAGEITTAGALVKATKRAPGVARTDRVSLAEVSAPPQNARETQP